MREIDITDINRDYKKFLVDMKKNPFFWDFFISLELFNFKKYSNYINIFFPLLLADKIYYFL